MSTLRSCARARTIIAQQCWGLALCIIWVCFSWKAESNHSGLFCRHQNVIFLICNALASLLHLRCDVLVWLWELFLSFFNSHKYHATCTLCIMLCMFGSFSVMLRLLIGGPWAVRKSGERGREEKSFWTFFACLIGRWCAVHVGIKFYFIHIFPFDIRQQHKMLILGRAVVIVIFSSFCCYIHWQHRRRSVLVLFLRFVCVFIPHIFIYYYTETKAKQAFRAQAGEWKHRLWIWIFMHIRKSQREEPAEEGEGRNEEFSH